MPTVIHIFIAPETHAAHMVWLLLSMALFLPVPYLYDTKPWFKFRLKVIGRKLHREQIFYPQFCIYYLWLTFMSFLMIPLSMARPCSVTNAVLGAKLMIPLSGLLGLDWKVKRISGI